MYHNQKSLFCSWVAKVPAPCTTVAACPTLVRLGSTWPQHATASGQKQPTQGMPPDCLTLVARGECISGTHRSETIRETALGRILPSAYCINSRLKQNPSLPTKRTYFLVMEPEGQRLGLPHIPRLQRCPQKTWAGKHHISALLCHHQSSLIPLRWELIYTFKGIISASLRAHLQISWSGSRHGLQL